MATEHETRKYDRDFLLSPAKRNQLVELWEVEKYGRDCFSDPNHVHLYGLPPKAWYETGVRILARTCLEAVKDPLGNKIGRDIAEVVLPAVGTRAIGVVDPFAGSCNGLYAILRHLPGGTTMPTFPGFALGVTSGTYDRTFDLTADSTYNLVNMPPAMWGIRSWAPRPQRPSQCLSRLFWPERRT